MVAEKSKSNEVIIMMNYLKCKNGELGSVEQRLPNLIRLVKMVMMKN
jgi:hypothetical protein